MIDEISAGIVIYRQLKTKREYLLLHYPSGHYDFPKGHIEKGESEKEAALRELKEETGIKKIVWIEGFRKKIRYGYIRHTGRAAARLIQSRPAVAGHPYDKKYSIKEVIFFLARTTQKKIAISFEHQGSVWLPYKEAIEKITYPQAKSVLKRAEKYLEL